MKEEQPRNNSAAIKQGPGSSSKDINNTFEFFCRNEGLHSSGGWWLHAKHKILRTSPCYFTTNQSEESLHRVENNEDPLPKWFSFKKLLLLSWIFSVGFWTQVYLLSRLPGYRANFFSNQHLSPQYWLLSGKQPNLSSLTVWLIWPW